jgi:hypothetical protein
MQVTTIGLDIAKNVFQVHGIDAAEKVVVRKQLRRRQVLEFFKALPPCLVGMEACATAHYWARELTKLGPGCVERGSMRAIVSATSISRSWSTDLSRIGSLTTQTLPQGVCWHLFGRAAPLG